MTRGNLRPRVIPGRAGQNWVLGGNDRLVSHSTSNVLPLPQPTKGWIAGLCEQVGWPCRWLEQGMARICRYLVMAGWGL